MVANQSISSALAWIDRRPLVDARSGEAERDSGFDRKRLPRHKILHQLDTQQEAESTRVTQNPVLSDERLIPTRDPQQFIAGLIRFQSAGGAEQFAVARVNVIPTQFRAQYLPGM